MTTDSLSNTDPLAVMQQAVALCHGLVPALARCGLTRACGHPHGMTADAMRCLRSGQAMDPALGIALGAMSAVIEVLLRAEIVGVRSNLDGFSHPEFADPACETLDPVYSPAGLALQSIRQDIAALLACRTRIDEALTARQRLAELGFPD